MIQKRQPFTAKNKNQKQREKIYNLEAFPWKQETAKLPGKIQRRENDSSSDLPCNRETVPPPRSVKWTDKSRGNRIRERCDGKDAPSEEAKEVVPETETREGPFWLGNGDIVAGDGAGSRSWR